MEYLTSINHPLSTINEENIEYVNIFDYPQFIFGNINFSNEKTNFCKVPKTVRDESKKYGAIAFQEMNNLYNSPCGNRLRFFTDSSKIIFKIKLKRKWGYQKMVNWNSLGFDVYNIIGNEYKHRTVFAPMDGKNIFAEIIKTPENGQVCIFLPSYNVIEELFVGIEKGSQIKHIDYPIEKRLPIIFYGNSITQGAAASRSGNTFPNIISKKLNQDIINLSVSSCCKGSEYMADLIGKINCSSIIIDYSRNANTTKELKENYESFYRRIREYHPNKKIILMTSSNFNDWQAYDKFDEVIIDTYKKAIQLGENTELLYQKEIFNINEFDFVTIDGSHYTDYGMFRIADELIILLKNESTGHYSYKSSTFTLLQEKNKKIDELINNNEKQIKNFEIYKKETNEIINSHNELFSSIILDHELKSSGTLKKIHLLCIELMKFIENVCEKYGLEYWLDYGTLLGAVRHEGYVPWDDDIDIGMCRKDFNKFLKVFPKEVEKYGLKDIISIRIDQAASRTWVLSFLQIAIYPEVHRYIAQVDIFPYDFIEECNENTIKSYEEEKYDFHIKLKKGIPRKSVEEEYFKKLKLSYKQKKYLIPGVECTRGKNELYKFVPLKSKEIFPLTKINFCGESFSCPKDSNYYLENIYNDYWELPKIIRTHNIASVMKKFPEINEFYQKYIDLMKEINGKYNKKKSIF